jgi:cytochrome c-type biogenesis protein CcmE
MSEPTSDARNTPPVAHRKKAFVFASLGAAAIAVAVLAAGGIGENLVYYWGPSEVHAAGDQAVGATIRLGGMVAADSVQYLGTSALEFDVIDGEQIVHVKATGVPPQMFREGIGVVVEGTMTAAGYFEGNRLMVSHDNEYRTPEYGESVDMKERMKTTKGLADDTGR